MEPTRLSSLARLFLKVGLIGVGGPAAHVALMHEEVVRKRKWSTEEEFALMVGATALVPGPNSTELAMLIGSRRTGWRGLIVAGLSFIVPAFLIVSLIAANYGRIEGTDVLDRLRYGIYPVVVAIIAVALVRLRKSTLGTPLHVVIGAGCIALSVVGVPDLLVLVVGGAVAVTLASVRHRLHAMGALIVAAVVPELWRIFLRFAEIGSVIFGSGYVLFAFLDSMLVIRDGWISESVLLDAIAVGQVTPGPVFTSATFIGWELQGLSGAMVATAGIFLPSFVFAAGCNWFVGVVTRTPWLRTVLGGVTAASIGLMALLVVRLADTSLTDVGTLTLAVVAAGVLLVTRISSVWIIGLGVLAGLVFGG
ncbi:MAG: chromate efflux transporter [Ilumatobacteraceae bacterium]